MDTKSNHRANGSELDGWIRALVATKVLQDAPDTTLVSLIDELADTYGDKAALLGEAEELSYRELAASANRYARWIVGEGLPKGAVLALLMPNCPTFVAIWIGATRAGYTVALINTNLRGSEFVHCLKVAGSKHLIVHGDLMRAVADWVPKDVRVWVHGSSSRLESDVASFNAAPLEAIEQPLPASSDRALLIYTSGTTGFPKAVNLTHGRVAEWSFWFAGMMDIDSTDRLYNCLPMYHSVGGVVAIGSMVVRGGSVVIRERFSASRFWDDVADTGCSIFQYIGELCRFLVLSPAHPKEQKHRLRLACGNGLHGEVWEAFQQRFNVPKILEFYAATEGFVSLYNCEGRPGAIGRIPMFLAQRFPVQLVLSNPETGEPVRDESGFCIACGVDEAGEAITPMGRGSSIRRFDGYTDVSASARKVLSDVFSTGDRWLRTGDLMRRDTDRYFYFVDRIGDTFRWRGENVATTHVAAVLRGCPGVVDAIVYGVVVPKNEGRAGMAAILTSDSFDLAELWDYLADHLPSYARPLFLRRCVAFETTGTFRLPKRKLVEEGYEKTPDPVWFNDRAAGCFIAYDEMLLRSIRDGIRRV